MNADTYAEITPEQPQNLDWFLTQIFDFRDFAALCFGLPLPLQHIEFTSRPPRDSTAERGRVRLFFRAAEMQPTKGSVAVYPIIPFNLVKDQVIDILSAWTEIKISLQQTIDLINVMLYTPFLHIENRFLLTMQAFEAFDRKTNPRTLISDKEFEELRSTLMASIPEGAPRKIRQKMDSVIKYANEPSLRQRLRSFYDNLEKSLGDTPMGLQKANIHKIANTRNWHTHYPPNFKDPILQPMEIYEEADRFCLLLIMSILDKLGFDLTPVKNGVAVHPTFGRFANPGFAAASTGF